MTRGAEYRGHRENGLLLMGICSLLTDLMFLQATYFRFKLLGISVWVNTDFHHPISHN